MIYCFAFRIVSDWSMRNDMQLNKKKFGIVISIGQRSHNVPNMMRTKENGKSKLTPLGQGLKVFLDEKYQYLGT